MNSITTRTYWITRPLVRHYNAANCEFYVNGLGRGYGFSPAGARRWLEAYISVPAQVGSLLNVGMWTRYYGVDECFSLGREIEPAYWLTGFALRMADDLSVHVNEFAFFIDVLRVTGEYVRLWQSRNGANYAIADVFAVQGQFKNLPRKSVEYADESSIIFDAKRLCRANT
jgi:hypothetical protein